ncbi:hypothetical protein SAMN02745146_2947 [Hymenobacter daecheongensis DSM 21074]|uniref:Uncharacterized protein n=1 Tax=Hymenobacter daecheongensis DSM 21074 TaxID=1121955 RepID=A0A1M6IRT4_9BACT|nr:hypothetical protein [Hymenobacter daecheongensis]SHJ37115.1 hypothetical protein SAMN02745146_2947 [Hymenobacter daecheongensis DSM 21074]
MSLPSVIEFVWPSSQAAFWVNEALLAARATRGCYLRQQLANAFRDEVPNLNLGELPFNEQAASISKASTQRVACLKSYNLGPDALQQLAAQTYNDGIDKPKTTTAATAQQIQDLSRYRQDDFRPATELLIATHPMLSTHTRLWPQRRS